MRTYFKQFHNKIRDLKSKNSKDFWDILKVNQTRNTLSNISIECMYEHFKKLNDIPENGTLFDPSLVTHSINKEINKHFTVQEINALIKNLKNNKSCGIDNIINEFIKHCPLEMKLAITKIFNIVLDTGIIPKEWCISLIQPIFKNKGESGDPDNYRGISLISCFGKLFTMAINERLTNYLDNVGLIGDEQAGFRKNYSTLDHIYVISSLIDLHKKQENDFLCIYLL